MEIYLIIIIIIFSFVCSYIDCAFGMGYGTLMSPILLIFGYPISVIVPILLLSQMCTGFVACIFHHRLKNANFSIKERDTHTALVFAIFGSVATIIAVFLVISVAQLYLTFYIGFSIVAIGIFLILKKRFTFSKSRLVMIGGISAFNKAISGGGFGPIVTSGQMISGSDPKTAIAITSFAETILSALGFMLYLIFTTSFDFELAILVIFSGVFAIPFGTIHAKRLNKEKGKLAIGLIILCLGSITLIQAILSANVK
ncbi:MAG: TSUP family transporter [Candidatus Lokiarchaeota archaeon]|nr:TSUP family transporter [Candidatus Lokiarchaeota archaeon]